LTGTLPIMAHKKVKKVDPLGKSSFKFVEPVRKKAERENLQRATCKLCKKFYDVVIDGNAKGIAECCCNHLQNSHHHFATLLLKLQKVFGTLALIQSLDFIEVQSSCME